MKITRDTTKKINDLLDMESHQKTHRKALCVCSAGLLRSATIAHLLAKKNYNTRNVGIYPDYSLIPITESLVYWADDIFFAENKVHQKIAKDLKIILFEKEKRLKKRTPVYIMNLPDVFEYMERDIVFLVNQYFDENLI